ncbi:conserved hypothetical protein [Leishmania major strain Friedlin]|uniref:OsmC-like protein n=1 Tax=Leishmania major TaxID=5664 RepID=Q4Q372_LEIMA|nr:conserved hypothetical protein [Leishmania major strain Friedlin]CAG9581982.1 OsmC-like_protein_-_putative [Leishmania major strain Friedlin]CAJ07840.1 conserved hypothetical protein [Leishmania major strain Friedlin]|eukprot:XP_001686226.1 conserved hypothetical protein [Leishmania major strain Friedlin]
MYRCTRVHCGVLAVLVGELKKVPAYVFYKAREGAKTYVDSASKAIEFLKGEDPNEDPVMRGKRRQHRELYQAVLREQAAKAQEDAAQRRARLSWKEKLQLSFQEARESVTQLTSAKAGVMALLQHCTASHTAEVALEQGIDVKNVQMVFEKAAASNSVGVEEIVVGYIDAPGASHEEVMAFAEKLHKVCPVAKSMHIEWRQGSADSRRHEDGAVRRADGLHREMEQAASGVEWAESRTGSNLGGRSSAADAASTTSVESMPAGMPGSRRVQSSMSSRATRGGSLRDDEDKLHFPGVEKRDTAWDSTRHGSSRAKEPSTETSTASHRPPPPESASAATTQPGACSSDPASASPFPKP